MKTVKEFHDELTELADRNFAEWEGELIAKIILAGESGQSKRDLLGINKKHRKVGQMPLFEEKRLF